jgi:hypothetical protein
MEASSNKMRQELRDHHREVWLAIWQCIKVFAVVWTLAAIASAILFFTRS